jgi:hypothetical protein
VGPSTQTLLSRVVRVYSCPGITVEVASQHDLLQINAQSGSFLPAKIMAGLRPRGTTSA